METYRQANSKRKEISKQRASEWVVGGGLETRNEAEAKMESETYTHFAPYYQPEEIAPI